MILSNKVLAFDQGAIGTQKDDTDVAHSAIGKDKSPDCCLLVIVNDPGLRG